MNIRQEIEFQEHRRLNPLAAFSDRSKGRPVPDEPAGLAKLLQVLAQGHVNVSYMYSLFTHGSGCAYMVLRISDEPRFLSALGEHNIKLMSMEELGLK